MRYLSIVVLTLASGIASAQTSAVPVDYQSLYSELQGKLTSFDSSISSQWSAIHYPTQFSGELLDANANNGLLLLNSGAVAKYQTELAALKNLGVQAVTVKIGYPILDPAFFDFNGDPDDYAKLLAFYQGVAADVRAAGLRLIVESSAIFPGFYSANSGLNVSGWYSSQSYSDLLAGYATVNATVATQIQPDYLNVGSEPDTEAKNTGFSQLYTPDGWASAINSFVSMIPPGSNIKIGAGVGTWLISNGQDFVQSILTTTNVDYIDLHIYPVNTPAGSTVSIPQNTVNLIDQAETAGKPVAVSEAWLFKTSDATYQQSDAATDPTVFSLDAYSFFAPLDQAFLQALWKLANWKQMLYLSPFWTRYFWAYLDYTQVSSLSPADLTSAAEQAAAAALQSGTVTSTGQFYQSLLAQPLASLVSAATLRLNAVAPASIVSIFGSGLATSSGNTTIAITDSSGASQPATIIYSSASQINAVLPGNLASGSALVSVTPAGAEAITGSFNVAQVAPGIFATSGGGSGVAAAETVTVHADGSVTNDVTFTCPGSGACTPKPIDVSTPGDTVYLVLFGTGFRNRSALASTSVTFAAQSSVPVFAGVQGGFAGLDQANVVIPPSLAGSGVIGVQLKADGVLSNAVTIQIQ